MRTPARLGLLATFAIAAGALALVTLLALDPLWLVVALLGGPLVGAVIHANLTRRAMGLTGTWEPGRAAARLAPGNASVRGTAGTYVHTPPDTAGDLAGSTRDGGSNPTP